MFRIDVHSRSTAQTLFGDRLADIFPAQAQQCARDSNLDANDSIYNGAGIIMQLAIRLRRQRH